MTNKECCDWRNKFEQAVEINDETLVREIIWNWNRFGTDDNGNFDCEECSEVLGKLFALVEAGARSPQEMRKRTQKELKESGISCCEVVKMLDVNDPNKTILHQQATAMKLNIEELACLKCNAYINYILEHFKPKD